MNTGVSHVRKLTQNRNTIRASLYINRIRKPIIALLELIKVGSINFL